MYQPAVNFTNPDVTRVDTMIHGELTGTWRTSDAEEHPCPPKTAAATVAILKHLEHGAHLFPAVDGFILDYL